MENETLSAGVSVDIRRVFQTVFQFTKGGNRMKTMLMTATVVLLSGALCGGGIIYENDFNEVSDFDDITWSFTAPFHWGDGIRVEDFSLSSPASMLIRAGGYTGGTTLGYMSVFLTLDDNYDVWAGGTGAVSVWVERSSKASNITVELRNGTTVLADALHVFSDYTTWHEVTIPLDGDETAINNIVFRTYTWQSNSSQSAVHVDDLVITPEPATILMLVGGLSMALRRRRRAA